MLFCVVPLRIVFILLSMLKQALRVGSPAQRHCISGENHFHTRGGNQVAPSQRKLIAVSTETNLVANTSIVSHPIGAAANQGPPRLSRTACRTGRDPIQIHEGLSAGCGPIPWGPRTVTDESAWGVRIPGISFGPVRVGLVSQGIHTLWLPWALVRCSPR